MDNEKEILGGVCVWFSAVRGIGFIKPFNSETDIFVHYKHIVGQGFRQLREGDIVEFEIGANDKGQVATNVKVLEKGNV